MTICLPKLLITGGGGQLGRALIANTRAMTTISLSKEVLDITNTDAVALAFEEYKPYVVVNAAAFTAVDRAETEQTLAMQVNSIGAGNIARVCARYNIPLIHLSTDYVFNGDANKAYEENDPVHALNYYGYSKFLGEQAVREQCEHHLILRISGLFSEFGHNFVKTILKLATERSELQVVEDQTTCPTSAHDVADAIFVLASNLQYWGTYHYCSDSPVSWHAFATHIVDIAKHYHNRVAEKIHPITSAQYQTLARRPAYSVLDCKKIHNDYQIAQPSWERALHQIIPQLLEKS